MFLFLVIVFLQGIFYIILTVVNRFCPAFELLSLYILDFYFGFSYFSSINLGLIMVALGAQMPSGQNRTQLSAFYPDRSVKVGFMHRG